MLEEKIFYHVVLLLAAVQTNLAEIFFFFGGGISNCYIEPRALGAQLNDLTKNHLPLK